MEWIKIEDELPKDRQRVLVFCKKPNTRTTRHRMHFLSGDIRKYEKTKRIDPTLLVVKKSQRGNTLDAVTGKAHGGKLNDRLLN